MTLQQTASMRLRALVATKRALLATRQAHRAGMVMLAVALASPARAQAIDLNPITTMFQGVVDALTGPLGVVLGTLAIAAVGITWISGYIQFSTAIWTVVGIVLVAFSPTIAGTLFT